jgi:energy-coupling factor transporter ATP-binding protein EcfA2
MLKEIAFAFGPRGSTHKLKLEPSAMTLIVGPNGSGKSRALREIRDYVDSGPTEDRLIVEALLPEFPSREQAEKRLLGRVVAGEKPLPLEWMTVARVIPDSEAPQTVQVHRDVLERIAEGHAGQGEGGRPKEVRPEIFYWYLSLFQVSLDGKTRLALTESRSMGDLLGPPAHMLAALFCDGPARQSVRELTDEAFGLHFVIDPTEGGVLRPRWSSRGPVDEQEEQALDTRARNFTGMHSAPERSAMALKHTPVFLGRSSVPTMA